MSETFDDGFEAGLKAAAAAATGWLAIYRDREIGGITARKYAVDAVEDIRDAILRLEPPAPQKQGRG